MTQGPIVRTAAGAIEGTTRDGVQAFLGVPYAAPPFGAHRFAAPQPVPPWEGVRPAVAFGPTAPKPPYQPPYDALLPEPTIPGEDCLNLNVWTPDPGHAGLPVFVWIHGGAFANGSGSVSIYDGATFARDGVVCVTINYRLGVDGFLHFDDGGPLNRGLLDQVAALEWVRDNIAAFGGDPARVTVGGESAGAFSVGALLAMPSAAGLFRQAVLQSGAGHHALSPATAGLVRDDLARRVDRPATREALADVPIAELIAAQSGLTAQAQQVPDPARWGEIVLNLMPFEPVVDGEVLPDLPIRAIAAGSAREVSVLVGSNRDDFRLFLVPTGVADIATDEFVLTMLAGYGAPGAFETYRRARPGGQTFEVLGDVTTDWFFRVPGIRLAEVQSGGAGAWMYEFSWPSPTFGGRLGACHALELGFTFDTLTNAEHAPLMGTGAPQRLADAMHAAWVAFIRDGDPGWAPYDLDRRRVQDFGAEIRLVDDPRAELRSVWDGVR